MNKIVGPDEGVAVIDTSVPLYEHRHIENQTAFYALLVRGLTRPFGP